MAGRPKKRFKRGQKVMVTERYKSHPKMSCCTIIPPGMVLTVLRSYAPDDLTDKAFVIVKRIRPKGFDLPIDEDALIPWTPTAALLYGTNQEPEEYY